MKKEIDLLTSQLDMLKIIADGRDITAISVWMGIIARENVLENWVPKAVEILKEQGCWELAEKAFCSLIQEWSKERGENIFEVCIAMISKASSARDLQTVHAWLCVLENSIPVEDWALRVMEVLRDTNGLDFAGNTVTSYIKSVVAGLEVDLDRARKINAILKQALDEWQNHCWATLWALRGSISSDWDGFANKSYELGVEEDIDIAMYLIKRLLTSSNYHAIDIDTKEMFCGLYEDNIQEIDEKMMEGFFQEGEHSQTTLKRYIGDRLSYWDNPHAAEAYHLEQNKMNGLFTKAVKCAVLSKNASLLTIAVKHSLDIVSNIGQFKPNEELSDLSIVLWCEIIMFEKNALELIQPILREVRNAEQLSVLVTVLLGCAMALEKEDCIEYLLSNYAASILHSLIFLLHDEYQFENRYIHDNDSRDTGNLLKLVALRNSHDAHISMLLEYRKDIPPEEMLKNIDFDESYSVLPPIATALSKYVKSGFSSKILDLYCAVAGVTESLPQFINTLLFDWATKNSYDNLPSETYQTVLLRGLRYLEKNRIDVRPYEEQINTVLTTYATAEYNSHREVSVLEVVFGKAKFIRVWFSRQSIVSLESFEQRLFKYEAMMCFRFMHFHIKKIAPLPVELVQHVLMFYILGDKSHRKDFHRAYCYQIAKFVCSEEVGYKAVDRMKALDFHKQESAMDEEAACVEGP